MREVKVRAPKGQGIAVARLAIESGAKNATIHTVFNASENGENDEIKVKTSTPKGKVFIDALLEAPFFDADKFTISSHPIRAVVSGEDVFELTEPFKVPPADVYEDFWQATHVTWSFAARAFISLGLLAYATLRAKFVLMIGALFFTIFSPPIMSVAFGATCGEWRLIRQGLKAFAAANVLGILGAFLTTVFAKGPLLVDDFGGLTSNVAISLAVGVVGAFADMDDVGHRQFIALAAAFPYAKFPTWIGICCRLGFPDAHTLFSRLGIFAANITAMAASAALTYWLVGLRRKNLARFAAR